MASSSAPVHPYRWLALFLVLLIGVYALVFLTGDKQAKAKLGIDLQGGTRVTLTARTPDGSKPTADALNQAQQIINDRVNGLGVAGSEVVIDGDNLVITVPGNDGNEARNLGQTARLFIRPVIGQPIPIEAIKQQMQAAGVPGAGGPGGPTPAPAPPPAPGPDGAAAPAPAPAPANPAAPAPQPRPYPAEPAPSPSPTPGEPAPAPAPAPGQPAPPTAAPAPGAPAPPPPSPIHISYPTTQETFSSSILCLTT